MMPSVADVQGLNIITRKILGNAAHALAGMVQHPIPEEKENRTLVGMSMFGVTTPCVQQVCALLPEQYEPLVFHATGTGGKALEKLIDSGMVSLAIDITLTEICDLFMGGVMSAGDDRLAQSSVPVFLTSAASARWIWSILQPCPRSPKNTASVTSTFTTRM